MSIFEENQVFNVIKTTGGTGYFDNITIVNTPINPSDAATKSYVDSHISTVQISITPHTEDYYGSALNGSDGEINRVLTINNTNTTSDEIIAIDNFIINSANYTATNQINSSTYKFRFPIFDEQTISVRYYTQDSANYILTKESFTGNNLSLSDGDNNRSLILANIALTKNELVIVDGFALYSDVQYKINNSQINTNLIFLIPIFDEQIIDVRYYTQ